MALPGFQMVGGLTEAEPGNRATSRGEGMTDNTAKTQNRPEHRARNVPKRTN